MSLKIRPIIAALGKDGAVVVSEDPGNGNCIYLDPDLYDIHVETYTSLGRSDAESAIFTALPTLLPSGESEYVFDAKVKRFGKKSFRAVGLMIKKSHFAAIRGRFPKLPVYIPISKYALNGETGKVECVSADKTDTFLISGNTAVLLESKPLSDQLEPIIESRPDQTMFHSERFRRHPHRLISIFLLAGAVGSLSGGIYLRREVEGMTERLATGNAEIRIIKDRNEQIERLKGELAGERSLLRRLQYSAPAAPYALLSAVAKLVPEGAVITSVVIKGSGFTIYGTTPRAIDFVNRLKTDPHIRNVFLEEITPLENEGGERFILLGRTNAK